MAAGPGTRLGAGRPKALVELAGEPLYIRSLRALIGCPHVAAVVVVAPPGFESEIRERLDAKGAWRCPVRVVSGGAERQDSVAAGLAAVGDAEIVAVHDAARPFVDAGVVGRAIETASLCGAAIVAVPASDTVKEVDAEGRIGSTPDRRHLWLAQTPQVFRTEVLRRAHRAAVEHGWRATDDAALVERLGEAVYVVAGGAENRKITTPEDLAWARWKASR